MTGFEKQVGVDVAQKIKYREYGSPYDRGGADSYYFHVVQSLITLAVARRSIWWNRAY